MNHILKTQFGIADGLADHNEVQLLDFATGTGTFLHEALQQMFEEPDIAGNSALDRGVIGVITNNNFLNAITLRQMRNRLMKDFNAIYILNLHGNSNIGENAPDGKPDKNVFDIRVGVAITFFVKTEEKPKQCDIYYASIQSSSKRDKWRQVAESDMGIFKPLDVAKFNDSFAKTRWSNRFEESVSLFVPTDDEVGKLIAQYGDFWGVTDIFQEYGSGVKTDRDDLVIDYDAEKLEAKMRKAFSGNYDADFANKYNITNSSSYNFADKLKEQDFDKAAMQTILYRPFDARKIYYKVGFTSRPAWETMKHMMADDNYGIITSRTVYTASEEPWRDIQITQALAEFGVMASRPGNTAPIFPLWRQPATDADKNNDMFAAKEREENFTPAFRKWLDKKYGKKYTPEQVLGYIYAVLHSPSFRTRYIELLKIDFPRIPFVDDAKQFEKLSALGWELVQAHLMKTIPEGASVELKGKGDGKVTMMNYVEATQQLHVNDTQYFTNISPVAWHFTIGGYQVLDKYLKSRKQDERPLGLTELRHIPKVVRILDWTHAQMEKIDSVWNAQM